MRRNNGISSRSNRRGYTAAPTSRSRARGPGTRNSLLMARLQIWALQRGGWNVFASSSGFRLGDGSVPNPDASLMRLERWEALSPQERRGFPPLCSDLVVEVASASDGRPQGATALLPDLHMELAEIWAG